MARLIQSSPFCAVEFSHAVSNLNSPPATHTRTGSEWLRRRIGIRASRWQSARVMKWSMLLAAALLLSRAGLAVAQTFTKVADVLSLSPEQLAKMPPVRLRGVVTYYKGAGFSSLLKYLPSARSESQRRRRDMFIDRPIKNSTSSVGATGAGNQG